MAILALGHHFVFRLVAGDAKDRFVLGGAGHQQVVSFLVAGSAEFGLGLGAIGYDQRHVGLVTLLAIGLHHFLGVGLMALGAIGNFPVNIVAERTCQSAVLALVLAQFFNLRCMAGEARIGHIVAEFDYLWRMGI